MNMRKFVNTRRVRGAQVYTDEHPSYSGLGDHEVIHHSKGQFKQGEVHTNGIEGHFSMLKRGIIGRYHPRQSKAH